MGYDTIGMLAFWFINFTMINRVMEGTFVSATDMGVVNAVVAWRPFSLFGLFSFSIPNLDMLTTGLPRLIKFDYSFFSGYAGFVQYSLYAVSFAVAFLLFVIIIGGLVSNFLNRTR